MQVRHICTHVVHKPRPALNANAQLQGLQQLWQQVFRERRVCFMRLPFCPATKHIVRLLPVQSAALAIARSVFGYSASKQTSGSAPVRL